MQLPMVRPRIPLSLRPALEDWHSRGLVTGESLGLSGGLVDPAKAVLPQKEEHGKVSKIQDIKNKILKNNAKKTGVDSMISSRPRPVATPGPVRPGPRRGCGR